MHRRPLRRIARLALCLPIALSLLAGTLAAPPPVAAGERRCFPETGYCAENAFYAFWATHGATAILGLPIGPTIVADDGRTLQFYERAVLEWHPAEPTAYQVQGALLGDRRLGDRPERLASPNPCDPATCLSVEATNHTIRDGFLAFWRANGDLAVFGYPLTEEFDEADPLTGELRVVQYFERSRFEFRETVMLGRLGVEAWRERPELHDRPPVATPDYTGPPVGPPARLRIPSIGVDAAVESVGLDAAGGMDTPRRPFNVAWFQHGSRPGQLGNAVIAGHVDYAGIGPVVFWRLRELGPGDALWVIDAAGQRRRFVVTAVESYRTAESPIDRIFGPAAAANLNLITCSGAFNPATRDYERRLVVYARWDGLVWP